MPGGGHIPVVGDAERLEVRELAGDVNASRGVSVADKFLVNNVLSQVTSAANFLRDVNLSGSITLADVLFVNANQSQAFPP